jgi:hypothetical protein
MQAMKSYERVQRAQVGRRERRVELVLVLELDI